MSCERYQESISAWVDGTLDSVGRRELEDHLAACAECGALATDLRRIAELARGLDRLQPPAALWNRIGQATRRTREPRPRVPPFWLGLAAAAVIVAAVSLAVLLRPAPDTTATVVSDTGASPIEVARTVEAELRLAEQHYENAIAGLEQLARDQQLLDPAVATTLQRNLQVIDAAISESRTALKAQPGSHPAQQSLFDAFRTKIALLEDTIYLLSEIRRNSQISTNGSGQTSTGDQSS
jgi:anti-sigma factor RsiW